MKVRHMKQIGAKKEAELKQALSPGQDVDGCFRHPCNALGPGAHPERRLC
jgi:hypothetical protein